MMGDLFNFLEHVLPVNTILCARLLRGMKTKTIMIVDFEKIILRTSIWLNSLDIALQIFKFVYE